MSRGAGTLAWPRVRASSLLAGVALYLATTQNLSFWHQVLTTLPAIHGIQQWAFIGVIFVTYSSALVCCLILLTPGPLLKPVLAVILVTASICSYFMDSYGVIIDETMMANVFHTDRRESSELLGPPLFLHVFVQGVIPALLVWQVHLVREGAVGAIFHRGMVLLIALLTLAGCIAVKYKDFSFWARQNRDVRLFMNPSYPLYSTGQVAVSMWPASSEVPLIDVGVDAHRASGAADRPLMVVIVVGETARAANFELDGYQRPTNPGLSAIKGLINYPLASSCGTSTEISVPCMFSNLGRANFTKDRAAARENVLDVVQRSGVEVNWLDNNSGCKGVCKRVGFEDRSRGANSDLCKSDGCYDQVLLDDLRTQIPGLGQAKLLILHQKGSHGPSYYHRYPKTFRRFTPDCVEDAVQTCSREQIINAYDNSILYTDYVLSMLIQQLQSESPMVDSVVMYLSDHGESLGENDVYLHGLPYALAPEEQKRIPFIAWFSSGAIQRENLDLGCVGKGADRPVSHDNLFDTVLGLFGIGSKDYRPENDLFKSCEAPL